MPWMTENGHEYNPNRPLEKNLILLARAERLMGVESELYKKFYDLVYECSNKQLDRDIEFRIMLDALELINSGIGYDIVAKVANADILLEVDLNRISPIQACVARDCVDMFTPKDFDFNELLPEDSFIKTRRPNPVKLEKTSPIFVVEPKK